MKPKKKSVAVQPRSIHHYEDRGYIVTTVEKWKEFPDKTKGFCPACKRGTNIKIRADMWNFADLLCVQPKIGIDDLPDIVLVQVTTRNNQAARYLKLLEIEEAKICLAAGIRIEVHGWAKVGAQGKRKLWEVSIREVTDRDFQSMPTVSDLIRRRMEGGGTKQAEETEPVLQFHSNPEGTFLEPPADTPDEEECPW